jgi:hypothetical protein
MGTPGKVAPRQSFSLFFSHPDEADLLELRRMILCIFNDSVSNTEVKYIK